MDTFADRYISYSDEEQACLLPCLFRRKEKRPEILRFQAFLVEISGIEPLTS
jgi:hypothetical protein